MCWVQNRMSINAISVINLTLKLSRSRNFGAKFGKWNRMSECARGWLKPTRQMEQKGWILAANGTVCRLPRGNPGDHRGKWNSVPFAAWACTISSWQPEQNWCFVERTPWISEELFEKKNANQSLSLERIIYFLVKCQTRLQLFNYKIICRPNFVLFPFICVMYEN